MSVDEHNRQVRRALMERIAVGLRDRIINTLDELNIPAEVNPEKNIRRSIRYEIEENEEGITGRVGSDLPYAPFIEDGTRPHRPPLDPIYQWVKKKLRIGDPAAKNVAWAVVKHIEKYGTPARHFMWMSLNLFIRGERGTSR